MLWKKRIRFGLRFTAFALFLAAIPASWLSWRLIELRQQRRVVAEIEQAGGIAYFDYQDPAIAKIPNASPQGPQWVRSIFGNDFFAKITRVAFNADRGAPGDAT